jgi:hypothetical protein
MLCVPPVWLKACVAKTDSTPDSSIRVVTSGGRFSTGVS